VALKKFTKDPDAVLDYTISWNAWLPDGDTITTATAEATSGIVVDSVSHTIDDTTVWLSGGVAGSSYDVTVHVTTNGGREDDRTITIVCKEL
jgi:hypothetical protein